MKRHYDEWGDVTYEGQWKGAMYHGHGKSYARGKLTHDGFWKEGKRHGFGKAYYSGSLVYEGGWEDDKKHGYGKAYDDKGRVVYAGGWEEDKKHRYGKAYDYKARVVYEGGWEENKRHGVGEEFAHDEHGIVHYRYSGEWQNDEPRGRGKAFLYPSCFIDHDGLFYDGEWKHGKKHGRGSLYHACGKMVSFIGSWCEGVIAGDGSEFDRSGVCTYFGGFANNEKHGYGKVFVNIANERTLQYEGDFVNGQRHGVGKLFHNCGRVAKYVGGFQCDFMTGGGKEFDEQGELVYSGTWHLDEYNGRGTLFTDTFVYRGDFQNGKQHGNGKLYNSAVLLYEGEWKDGLKHGVGTEYHASGRKMHVNAVFVNGAYSKTETDAKRQRESRKRKVASLYGDEMPKCSLCFESIHIGEHSYAYVPCGHRILCEACGDTLAPKWKTQCILCKGEATAVVKLYS